MSGKLQATLATLMLGVTGLTHAQSLTFSDVPLPNSARPSAAAPRPASSAPASAASTATTNPGPKASGKRDVELLCDGTLRVFYVLPDGNERDSGAEHRHEINLRVTDKKIFRSFDDAESAIQIRFDDPKSCLGRANGAACLRQVDNPDGKRMSTKDHLDIDRFTGRMVYNYVRSYPEPVQRGNESISAVRLEYAGQCGRADAPRPDSKPIAAPATPTLPDPKTSAAQPAAPAIKKPPVDGKPAPFWVVKEPTPEAKR